MKRITSILSLVAIVASALFVTSCAQKKTPDMIPAFPSNKFATYGLNDKGEILWSWESTYGYTNAKGGGFGVASGTSSTIITNKLGTRFLEYRITPNFAWTAEVVGDGQQYIELGQWLGEGSPYNEEDYTWGATASGDKGLNSIYVRVIKTPVLDVEEAVDCKISLTMNGETMTIATLTIEPCPEDADDSTDGE